MTENIINWQPVRNIPRTPGVRITIKDNDGELHNVRVGTNGSLTVATHEIKAWIPNNEV